VDVEDDKVAGLRDMLKLIGDNIGTLLPDYPIEFNRLTTVHFMRWVVLDPAVVRGERIPAHLVLSTNYDLPLDDHLRELVIVAGSALEKIYSQCKGFQLGQDLLAFLKQHRVNYAAFYVGTRGRSVEEIRREKDLRERIQGYLDKRGTNSQKVRDDIQNFVAGQPDLQWARQKESIFLWALQLYGPLVLLLVALLAAYVLVPLLLPVPWWALPLATVGLLVGLVVAVVVWRQVLIAKEKQEDQDEIKINVQHVQKLVEREDHVVQNQLSHLVEVKPGWFRLATLRLVLWAINLLARYLYVTGTLGGIPTIHFARWVIIDQGRRLLFFSNFDGSWENYLGDFIDKAAAGLTAVWSNTVGCPKAQGLINEGARDEQRFKSWTRDHQIFTQVWYSAYEDVTVDNINNNSRIRNDLFGNLSPEAAKEWLSRL
jgi:membrane protein implicated in regulation of membrane protease activity